MSYQSTNGDDENTNTYLPNRFVVPVLYVLGWIGGWLCCMIWYGKLF